MSSQKIQAQYFSLHEIHIKKGILHGLNFFVYVLNAKYTDLKSHLTGICRLTQTAVRFVIPLFKQATNIQKQPTREALQKFTGIYLQFSPFLVKLQAYSLQFY